MPTKKNSRKRSQPKKTVARKAKPARKPAPKKSAKTAGAKKSAPKRKPTAKKKPVAKKKAAPRKAVGKKAAVKKPASAGRKAAARSASRAKPARPSNKRVSTESQIYETDVVAVQQRRSRSGGQSGDLQGLSGAEGADSESVDELLEEGNAFEADVVAGVQRAGDADEEEVHTHQVPEDDVPEEYLDED